MSLPSLYLPDSLKLREAASGRKCDLANGRFVELQFAEYGFGGTAVLEKAE